jgi:RND family efflux transporter MFP subunit
MVETPALPSPRLRGEKQGVRGKRKVRRFRLWQFGGVVVLLALAGWGGQRWFFPGSRGGGEIIATVTRADLPIIVTERGQLESARTVTCKCEVEGESSKIVFLVPEGDHVKKGEVVVRFDSDKIRRAVSEQEIKFKTADGKARAAKEELDVQKNKAESEIAKAELALALAKLDREKYLDGDFKVEEDEKKAAINLAERELKEAEEKLEGFRTFVKKGFGTPEQLVQKELEVEQKKNSLESNRAKLMVLQKYMLPRQKVELTAKEKEAERELARTNSIAKANIAKAETDYQTSVAVMNLEKEQLERIRAQLDQVEIKAPEDGIVVYEQARFWDPASRVQLGGMVTYQQPVFQLPDLESMQVKVKIHESKVKKVKPGQKAEIRMEAFPGMVLHGTVLKVATLADQDNWRGGGAKEFETILRIDDLPKGGGLKPGFTAEVSIEVNYLPKVLTVPVQAVAQREGKHYAYVQTDSGIERREVTVGENNEKYVEVRSGLNEGEAVCLDARARATAEAQAGANDKKDKESATK